MKKSVLIAAMMLTSVMSFAQSGKSIYNKYSGAESTNAVYISDAMFKMIGKIPDLELDDCGINLGEAVKSLEAFYLVSVEDESTANALKADVERFVEKGSYEVLMEVKEERDNIRIFTIGNERIISGCAILVTERSECTFICIDGEILRDDLIKIMNAKKEDIF